MLDQGHSGRLGQAELAIVDIELAVGLVAAELLEQSERLQFDLQGVDDQSRQLKDYSGMIPTLAAIGGVARLLQTLVQNVIQPPLGPYTTQKVTGVLAAVEARLNSILDAIPTKDEEFLGSDFDTYADSFTVPAMEVIRAAEELVVTQEAPGIDVWEPQEEPGTIPGEKKIGLLQVGGVAVLVGVLVAVFGN